MYVSNSNLGSTMTVPSTYIVNGTIGDLGVIVGNENNNSLVYVAKSSACALLQSNFRPIWGAIIFNNAFLKYDQEGFQETLFVAVTTSNILDSRDDPYPWFFSLYLLKISSRKSSFECYKTRWKHRLLFDKRKNQSISLQTVKLFICSRNAFRRPRRDCGSFSLGKKSGWQLIYDRFHNQRSFYEQRDISSPRQHRLVYFSQLFLRRAHSLGKESGMWIFEYWQLLFPLILHICIK